MLVSEDVHMVNQFDYFYMLVVRISFIHQVICLVLLLALVCLQFFFFCMLVHCNFLLPVDLLRKQGEVCWAVPNY